MSDAGRRIAQLSPQKQALLRQRLRERAATGAIPRRAGAEAPLSFAQERIWLAEQLRPGMATYHMPIALRLRGALDCGTLRKALAALVERHEALRTCFERREGAPVQTVGPPSGALLSFDDLGALPPEAREARARAELEREARVPFDLARQGPIRARLLRLDEREHWLCVVLHHIAADGWSLAILLHELSALYGAALEGRPPPLAAPPAQYADFAAWQRQGTNDDEAALAFWRERLRGAPPGLDLPPARPRPAVPTGGGGVARFRLEAPHFARLAALARDEGATTFMALFAGVQALAHRYTGHTDFVLSTAVAGRGRPELERVVGCFVNLLPLRARVEGGGFRELLRRVRRDVAEAFQRHHVPFERTLDAAAVPRGGPRAPFTELVVVLQNTPAPALALPGLEVEHLPLDTATARFDLTLSLQEAGDGIEGTWEFDTDLFDPPSVERMGRHLVSLLESAAAHPDTPLARLPMADERERALLAAWAGTTTPRPGGVIHELFSAQAARTPDAPALLADGRQINYAELDARTDRMARALRRRGVGPECRVGVRLERSVALLETLLAVLKAGGAYVPIDPSWPREHAARVLRDAGARWLVTTPDALALDAPPPESPALAPGEHPETDATPCERLDPASLASDAGPSAPPDASVGPDHLAYIMYTSGSTGQPKGVGVTHRGVARLVIDADYVELGPGHVHLQLAPSAFDASTFEIWGALLTGGCLAVPPPGPLSPRDIGRLIDRHRVTTLWLTAGLFHVMIDEAFEALAPLRQLLAGGDTLSVAHVARARRALPGCALVNGYGPTENTTFSCCHRIDDAHEGGRSIPIGRPIARSTAWTLDEHMTPTPVGVPGELYVGGEGLARGYLGRPALTAERFVPDPFGDTPGGRLYRTGDRARWTADGVLEFLGRRDRQVKVRGHRIEPGEIELALEACEGVRAAAVVATPAPEGGDRLVAYVCPTAPGATGPADVRAALAARLPAQLVPEQIVFVEQLPLSPNGKIDRHALAARPVPTAARRPPAPGTEARLACVWSELLGVAEIGPDDDFFALGGTSLTAMRLAARVERDFDRPLSLRAIYEAMPLGRLAALLEQRAPVSPPGHAAAPRPREAGAPSLAWLEDRGASPPLVLPHAASGSALCYLPLVRALGPERKVLGLDAPSLSCDLAPRATLAQMAGDCVAALLNAGVDGEGEFLLSGWSLGGLLAFEMACQLERRGLSVAALVLFDAWAPPAPFSVEGLTRTDLLAALVRDLSAGATGPTPSPESLAGLPEDQQLAAAAAQARAAGALGPDASADGLGRMLTTYAANLRAFASWRPTPYAGTLHLISASQTPNPFGEESFGWSQLARSVQTHTVPGDHHSIMRPPGVAAPAECLRAILAQAPKKTL